MHKVAIKLKLKLFFSRTDLLGHERRHVDFGRGGGGRGELGVGGVVL